MPGEPEGRALLENRNVTNGPMSFAHVVAFAKAYFEWMYDLSFHDVR